MQSSDFCAQAMVLTTILCAQVVVQLVPGSCFQTENKLLFRWLGEVIFN
jgi:hypothetical protein